MGLLHNAYYLNSNDLGVIIFQNLGCLFVVLCLLVFGGPGTLLVGGVYESKVGIMYIYIYVYMYMYIYIYI